MGIRDDILSAGSLLLREKGVTALTQPQIAQAANIKQSHLTYYFPTRAELLLAIAEHTLSTLMENIAAQLQSHPEEKTLADAVAKIMTEGFPPRVFVGLIVAADSDPEIRKLLRKLVRHVRTSIQHLLKQAGLASDSQSALLFHAGVIGLAILHYARQHKESADEVRSGIPLLAHLLQPPRSRP